MKNRSSKGCAFLLGFTVYQSSAALLCFLAFLIAPVGCLFRARWCVGLGERLGFLQRSPTSCIWVHGASMGETRLSLLLAQRLMEQGQSVRLTTTSVTARSFARRSLPQVQAQLAPLDFWPCLALAHWRLRPKALILIETEFWPGLLYYFQRFGQPVALFNGRVSPRTWTRYKRLGFLFSPLLAHLAPVLPATSGDRERLLLLGCSPHASLMASDLKLCLEHSQAVKPPPGQQPWTFLCGSLHLQEVELWLDLIRQTRGLPLAHAVAPRHPEGQRALEGRLNQLGIPFLRWSALRPSWPSLESGQILLLDTLGELKDLYQYADLTFVGGSLVPRGGHNLLEPAFWGKPVFFGPHTFNQSAAAQLLEESGGGRRIADFSECVEVMRELLQEPEKLLETGQKALTAVLEAQSQSEERFSNGLNLLMNQLESPRK